MKIYCEVDMNYLDGDAGRALEAKISEQLVERIKKEII